MLTNEICWKCGKKIPQEEFFGNSRRFCERCEEQHLSDYQTVVTEYSVLKTKVMFERAMRIMEKARVNMTKYKRFANAVQRHAESNPGQYFSSYEMIVAVILLSADYDFEMNKKIGNYRTDVYIPDLHICLEIDGERHKHSKKEDGQRDINIRQLLGWEWEIVRIPTKYIDENPEKIIEAMNAVYSKKKELRGKNNGILPEYYSGREKAAYSDVTLYVKRKVL